MHRLSVLDCHEIVHFVNAVNRLGGRPTAAARRYWGESPADLYRRHPGSLIGNLPTPHTYPTNLCGFHQTVYASSANAVARPRIPEQPGFSHSLQNL